MRERERKRFGLNKWIIPLCILFCKVVKNKLLHIPLSLHIVYGREKMCFDFYIKYKNWYILTLDFHGTCIAPHQGNAGGF